MLMLWALSPFLSLITPSCTIVLSLPRAKCVQPRTPPFGVLPPLPPPLCCSIRYFFSNKLGGSALCFSSFVLLYCQINAYIWLSFPRRVPASPGMASLPRACTTVYGECSDHKVRIKPCSHRCTATIIHTTEQDGSEGVLILKARRTGGAGASRPTNKT